MARASPVLSFSSSSSAALPSSASPPPRSGSRKKKIGALLSSYYNLESENAGKDSCLTSAAAATTCVEGRRDAAAASNGAVLSLSASPLPQMPCAPHRPLADSDIGGDGGAAAAPSSGSAAAASTSFNPFSATEDSSPWVVSSSPPASGDERAGGGNAVYFGTAPCRSHASGGSRDVATAAVEGCSSSNSSRDAELRSCRSQSSLGNARGVELKQEEETAAAAAAARPAVAARGFAAAGDALGAAAVAAAGQRLALGEEEDSSRQFMRWNEKEEGTRENVEDSKNLDSEHFDVRAFFSAAVESMSLRELLQASSKLDEEVRHCEGELQMLVYENYTKFLEAAETVRGVKEDMHALQGDMTQLAVRAAAIEGSSKELDDLVRDRAASIEELVSFRQLLDKLQILFTLPDVLRWYLSNEDTESVLSVYLRVCPFLQQQEAAFPTLQRLHLLHAEAASLFQAAKRRLRQQLVGSQSPTGAAPSWDLCGSKSGRNVGGTSGSSVHQTSSLRSINGGKYLSSRGTKGKDPSGSSSSSSNKDSTEFDWAASAGPEESTSCLSAAAGSRVFHLLLRAGEPPRELLQLYMRNRMHMLRQLLQRVFDVPQLLQTTQPTSRDAAEPPQDQQPGAQQQQIKPQQQAEQQRQDKRVCPDDCSTATDTLYRRSEPSPACTNTGETAASAATEECAAGADNLSSAAAAGVLDAACSNLEQLFMDPFVAALQDILHLHPSGVFTPTAVGAAACSDDKRDATSSFSSPPPSLCPSAEARSSPAATGKPRAAVRGTADCAAAAAAQCFVAAGRGEGVARLPPAAAAAVATRDPASGVAVDKAAAEFLSAKEVENSLRDFLLSLLLWVLEGFLRLVIRLNAPAAAVIEVVRTLRAVLLQRLQELLLPEPLKQRITKRFQNFTYQVLSACVAAAFRAAYVQAAEELVAIQRFCFCCTSQGAAGAAAGGDAATPAREQIAHPHSTSTLYGTIYAYICMHVLHIPGGWRLRRRTAAPCLLLNLVFFLLIFGAGTAACAAYASTVAAGNFEVKNVCFFLDEQAQEAAQQLLSQKEHAVLLRGCLAVTDVHKLIECVCGVRSPLAEKLVVQEVSRWIAGFFSVFVTALLRLARDTPAALQDCPLLRAEAEALRRRESAARRSRSSSGQNAREDRSGTSRRESTTKSNGSTSSGTGIRSAFFVGKEDDEGKTQRCCKCCYCWRYHDVKEAAMSQGHSYIERQEGHQIEDSTGVASLEKALLYRCTSVEDEVAEAVAAAVAEHLWTPTRVVKPRRSKEADPIDPDLHEEEERVDTSRRGVVAMHALPAEPSRTDAPASTSLGDPPLRGLQSDVLPGDMSVPAPHAGTPHTHTAVKLAVPGGDQKVEELDAVATGTELVYIGRTALLCVLLMRLGRSLELHGVSKVVAVAAELFPSFPVDLFIPTSPAHGAASENPAAADGSAAATVPSCGEGTAPAAAASAGSAGVSLLSKQKRQQHTSVKELPLVQLRQVLQAALVTYVYLRGCQGAALSTAALRSLLVPKLVCDTSPRLSAAEAPACSAPSWPATTIERAASLSIGSGVTATLKTVAAAEVHVRRYGSASEWLALKDMEAQVLLDADAVQAQAAGGLAPSDAAAEAVVNAPAEKQVGLSANPAAATLRAEATDGSTHMPATDRSNSTSTSTAASSVSPCLQGDKACFSASQTSATHSGAEGSDAVAVDGTREDAADSAAESTAVVTEARTHSRDAEDIPVEVVGLMDTLLLLLHHCDEETYVFLGEQKFSGSGVLLRSGGVGGVSAALLPGSARLPRRLQAIAAAGDAAAAAVEQRQHQHVRRLARLFGRRRTAIEKQMERLFARKQPVFSRVSLNRHKTIMAIFKVACRPFLEAVRSTHFTRLEVRQMQVECAAAAESLRDVVASEDGCIVDGLLDELVESSLRRCLQATQVDESVHSVRIDHCAAAVNVGTSAAARESHSVHAAAAIGIRRSRPAAAVSRWGSAAAESSVAAAYTRMAERRGAGTGDTGEDNVVLLKPTIIEEICNRCSDRYHRLLTSNTGRR